MTRIEIVEDTARFAALRDEWDALLGDTDADGLFLTWEWLYTWWRHLAEDRRLRIITVRRGGRLIAVAPLARRARRWRRLIPFPAQEFLGGGEVGSDHLDLLIRRGSEGPALAALAEALAGERVMLELTRVRHGAHLLQLARETARRGWAATESVVDVCPYVDLEGLDWPGYLARLGPSHRYNLRRRLRNLEKQGELRFDQAETDAQRAAALDDLVTLHQQRWQRRGMPGAFCGEDMLAFHREVSRLALVRGWLRLYSLKLDRRTAAVIYGFLYHDVFYFYQSGFDMELQRHSVGLVTMGLAIKTAIEDGAKVYDFLCGDEGYKALWTQSRHPLLRLMMYPPGRLGTFYRQSMGLRGSLKKVATRRAVAG